MLLENLESFRDFRDYQKALETFRNLYRHLDGFRDFQRIYSLLEYFRGFQKALDTFRGLQRLLDVFRDFQKIYPQRTELNPICKSQLAELFCGAFKFCACFSKNLYISRTKRDKFVKRKAMCGEGIRHCSGCLKMP